MEPASLVLRPARPAALEAFLTATDEHYVLGHHGIAHPAATGWTLRLDGLVERELVFDLEELRRRPARTVTAVLECAGNPEDPDRPTRIVSNAAWRGPSLAGLLRDAGLRPGAAYVWMRGEDWGTYAGVDNDSYVKDIPVAKAMDEDVIVAYEMNGSPLGAEHGSPLRVLVPGYYGTSSVKWLSGLSVRAERPGGLFTTTLYNHPVGGVRRPVWGLAVNSLLTRPRDGERLGPVEQELRGWAWGDEPVASVEVSVDGGRTWTRAHLEPRRSRAWQGFTWRWRPAGSGTYTIAVRATDGSGATQPEQPHVNQVQRVTVTVDADPPEVPSPAQPKVKS